MVSLHFDRPFTVSCKFTSKDHFYPKIKLWRSYRKKSECPTYLIQKCRNIIGLFRKNPNRGGVGGGVKDIIFWKPPWDFSFFYFTPENSRQNKAQLFHKIVLDLWEIPRPKTKTPVEILYLFFLVTLGNPTSFLINPQKFHCISLIPLEIPYSQNPCENRSNSQSNPVSR